MVRKYFDRDGIQLFHGDCREVLPTLPAVDLLLTDPPYGIGEARGKNRSRGLLATSKDYGNAAWDDAPPPRWLLEQAIEKAAHAIIFGGNYFGLPSSSCWLVWDKDNGETDFADCELAWTNLPKAVRRIKYRWQGMLQEHMGGGKEVRVHPTQKPLAVMAWAIQQAPDSCRTILDPFAGSGTTLVAARDAGRLAIGVESDERHCETIARRLEQGVLQWES